MPGIHASHARGPRNPWPLYEGHGQSRLREANRAAVYLTALSVLVALFTFLPALAARG